MSLTFQTTLTRVVVCEHCQSGVAQKLAKIYGDNGWVDWWQTQRHTAPCGLPCASSGASTSDYRARQVHAASTFPCPRCGVTSPLEGP